MTFPIISLGTNCEITFNVRRFTGNERAYPFDWWITPLASVAGLIRSRFSVDFSKENLSEVGNGASVLNRRWGILHHHDFPRDCDGMVSSEWRESIKDAREKYAAISERFFSDLNNTDQALFVINRDGRHQYHSPDSDQLSSDWYIPIANAVAEAFPRLVFRIAIFNAADHGVHMAGAADSRLWVAPPVVDYGDRVGGEANHFGASLRGWEEALSLALQNASPLLSKTSIPLHP